MAALPYIQLYVADYLADTAHLKAIEHGAYLLLIMNYWQTGKPLNNSNERLTNVARMSNAEWNESKKTLQEFFKVDGDTWTHLRIEADLFEIKSKSIKASDAGKKSAEARRLANLNKRSLNVEQTFNHTDTDTDTDTDTEKNQEQKSKSTPDKPAFVLPDWIDADDWNLWLKTRKGKKMIPEQMLAQVKTLDAWRNAGIDHKKALSDAAKAGWQGLFEPKTSAQLNIRGASPPTGKQAVRDSYAVQAAEANERMKQNERYDERDITAESERVA